MAVTLELLVAIDSGQNQVMSSHAETTISSVAIEQQQGFFGTPPRALPQGDRVAGDGAPRFHQQAEALRGGIAEGLEAELHP